MEPLLPLLRAVCVFGVAAFLFLGAPGAGARDLEAYKTCATQYAGLKSEALPGPGREIDVRRRLNELGLSVDPQAAGQPDGLLSFVAGDAPADPKSAEALKKMRALGKKFGVEFRLPLDGSKLSANSALGELSLSESGGGLKVVLGKDFLSDPAVISPYLQKLEDLLQEKVPQVTGLRSRVVALNLATGRVKRELLGEEGATSGPAMWIRNRLERHGVHVYVDDGEFGPGRKFEAFSRGTNVFLRSRALEHLDEEKTMRIIGHELHHASGLAKCLKSNIGLGFNGCEQLIMIFSEKGGGFFGFFQHQGDISKFPGYAHYFRSDELEAYKISKNPQHALEMASRQIPWLRQLKEEIAGGDPQLLQNLAHKFPAVRIKTPEGLYLRIGLPVDHEFATAKEAQEFYEKFLEKRIQGIEVIDNVVDHPTGLGQPHYNFIKKFWDRHFSEG